MVTMFQMLDLLRLNGGVRGGKAPPGRLIAITPHSNTLYPVQLTKDFTHFRMPVQRVSFPKSVWAKELPRNRGVKGAWPPSPYPPTDVWFLCAYLFLCGRTCRTASGTERNTYRRALSVLRKRACRDLTLQRGPC